MIIDLTLSVSLDPICICFYYLLLYSSLPMNPPPISTPRTPKLSQRFFCRWWSAMAKTVIMTSHDPKAVEQFKKVYNMRDGNFV